MQIFIVYYIARINVVVYQSLKMSFDSKRKKDEDIYFKLVFTLNYPNAFCCKGKLLFLFLYSSVVWIFFLFLFFLFIFLFGFFLFLFFSYLFFFAFSDYLLLPFLFRNSGVPGARRSWPLQILQPPNRHLLLKDCNSATIKDFCRLG